MTGILLSRPKAVSSSSRTQSLGSFSRKAPFSSRTVSQCLPMTAIKRSHAESSCFIWSRKSSPGGMLSTSRTIEFGPNAEARRLAMTPDR
jgi:hypothetical protein